MSNAPLSEQYHNAWSDWCQKKQASDMLEGMKTAVLSQMIKKQGDVPYAHAERDVKASAEWQDYVKKMVEATTATNLAKGRVEFLKMKFYEWQSAEANHRAQARA